MNNNSGFENYWFTLSPDRFVILKDKLSEINNACNLLNLRETPITAILKCSDVFIFEFLSHEKHADKDHNLIFIATVYELFMEKLKENILLVRAIMSYIYGQPVDVCITSKNISFRLILEHAIKNNLRNEEKLNDARAEILKLGACIIELQQIIAKME